MEKEEGRKEIEEILNPKLPTKIRKEVKVQENKASGEYRQYSIRFPQDFVDELKIKKGDIFIIECDPETKEYSIKLKVKEHGKKAASSNRQGNNKSINRD
jgi:hypothetical protein